MRGFVSLVGVGPGDPGLLTLRGRGAIERADTVLFDALVHPAVLRHARPEAERLFVGKRGDQASTTQDEINHTLLLRAGQGRRVARLKGGDALVFGRGAEEAEFLSDHGVAFEVIPGVSAALGATAYAGIPLTHRDLASSVALVTSRERSGKDGESPLRAAAGADTVVIFMGLARLADDMATLLEAGRVASTPVAIISAGAHPEQLVVVGTIADIVAKAATASVRSPALIVVGGVVGLRDRLRWWDRPGLHGRRVLVARAPGQGDATVEALVAEGAIGVEVPMIRVAGPTHATAVTTALDALAGGGFDVVAFTSVNGVERTFDALGAMRRDARSFGGCEVVAVGPETARALREHGIVADATPDEHHGAAVAACIVRLRGDRLSGTRVLLARAEVAGDDLPALLDAGGAVVSDVAVYRTVGPIDDDRARVCALWDERGIDAVLLTSGSVARHLAESLGARLDPTDPRVVFASIGPSTSAAARAVGVPVHVEAREHTVDGLLEALRDHYRQGASALP